MRLCHKTRIVSQAVTRRKYHTLGSKHLFDAWRKLSHASIDGCLKAWAEEREPWAAALLKELNNYAPGEAGYREMLEAYQLLDRIDV